MPTVAVVDGIRIMFYANDHGLPHFHAMAADRKAVIRIDTLSVIEGSLPRNQLRKVVAWAESRRQSLVEAWADMRSGIKPGRIE